TLEKLKRRIYGSLTNKLDNEIKKYKEERIVYTIEVLTREHKLCLILDNPFTHFAVDEIYQLWKFLIEDLKGLDPPYSFFLILLNKTELSKEFLAQLQHRFQSDHSDSFEWVFPCISPIKKEHFNRLNREAKEYFAPFHQSLQADYPEILQEKNLKKVVEKLCQKAEYPDLPQRLKPSFL
ncbi:MAG: hypothetical protein AAF135_21660, partial [Bacteroidota bacterium]